MLRRAQDYPKPMFFSPERFDFWLQDFMASHGFSTTAEMDADGFARWVFPRLFENRLPKYQAIVDRYGTTISSEKFQCVQSADDFLQVIIEHLPDVY